MAQALKRNTEDKLVLFGDLRDRLQAAHNDAQAAWAKSAAIAFADGVRILQGAIKQYEIDSVTIGSEEDVFRLRAELAELLRSASAALAPRTV